MYRTSAIIRLGCGMLILFLVTGCGGETSVQKAPEGSDIQQYLAENPDALDGESLDAADAAEMEE